MKSIQADTMAITCADGQIRRLFATRAEEDAAVARSPLKVAQDLVALARTGLQYHLFRVDVGNIDGLFTYYQTAVNDNLQFAKELAINAVLEHADGWSTGSEPLDEDDRALALTVTYLGIIDREVFDYVGPYA